MSVWGDPVMIGSGGGVSAADNGKVVVSGALVAQTARAITANGTYDTTTNDSVTVNVPTNIGKNLLYLSRYGSPTVWTGGSLRVTESESNDTSVVTVSGTATQYDGATWTVPFNVTQLFQGCKLRVYTDDPDISAYVTKPDGSVIYGLARKSNPVVTINSYGSYTGQVNVSIMCYAEKTYDTQLGIKITGV